MNTGKSGGPNTGSAASPVLKNAPDLPIFILTPALLLKLLERVAGQERHKIRIKHFRSKSTIRSHAKNGCPIPRK